MAVAAVSVAAVSAVATVAVLEAAASAADPEACLPEDSIDPHPDRIIDPMALAGDADATMVAAVVAWVVF